MGDNDVDSGWTKPKQSFKLKKAISRGRPGQSNSAGNRTLPELCGQAVKRRNPFLSDDFDDCVQDGAKRPKLGDIFSSNSMFTQKKTIISKLGDDFCSAGDSRDSGLSDISQSSDLDTSTGQNSPNLPSNPPVDWSLKSKARFVSTTPLGWTQHLSTVEEASGVTGGVRCLSLSKGSHCLNTSNNARFHSLCLYWQHPSLPVPLFPRYSLSSMTKPASNVPSLSLSPDMQRALHSDWMSSLQSVYQLVKARQCPYFYLLAPSFTCLFRAAGVAGVQQMTALLTPSTSGIRAALKREEIEFTLPLFKPRDTCEDDVGPECDTTNEFLESLGIEADSLPGLSNPIPKNRLAAGSSQNIDGKVESLVMVEGVECQSLLNYLLNAKLVVGKDQLPPTILAPVAYHGASLRTLRVKQGQTGGKGGVPLQHSIELNGPILPHMVQGLSKLASNTASSFSTFVNTVEETNSFSLFCAKEKKVAPSAFATASLDDCGLDAEMLKIFCDFSRPENEGVIVRDLLYDKNRYIVNSRSQLLA